MRPSRFFKWGIGLSYQNKPVVNSSYANLAANLYDVHGELLLLHGSSLSFAFAFGSHCLKVLCPRVSKIYILTTVTACQKAFIFGPKVSSRDSFHSVTYDLGSMPMVGARGQNLGPYKKWCFFFLLFCYENNLDRYLVRYRSTLWYWLVGHVVKVSLTYILHFSDFALLALSEVELIPQGGLSSVCTSLHL